MADHEDPKDGKRAPHEILNVFGVKLTVYNERLADLLTMEAGEALGADVVSLITPGERGSGDADATEGYGAPPVAVPEPGAAFTGAASAIDFSAVVSDLQETAAQPFDQRIDEIGQLLGFEVTGESWRSPSGVSIVARRIEGAPDLGGASALVEQVRGAEGGAHGEVSGVFVVDDQMSCDIFRVAIRKADLYSELRVISLDNLEVLVRLRHEGAISHRQVVSLLVPLANIDVGDLLNVIRASRGTAPTV